MKRNEFHELISIEKAEQILKSIIHGSTEVVPLDQAYHSILAEDVVAAIDVPSFDRADMDGYAVRAADTYTAREDAPVQLVIRGVVHAGYVPALSISAGVTAEIATGAMLPDGADAVVMVEYTEQAGASTRSASSLPSTPSTLPTHSTPPESGESAESSVLIRRAVHAGENVMRAGVDIKQGHRVLSRGTQLGSREVGVLAAIGRHDVHVSSLSVGIISTGTELVPTDEPLQAGQVHDVNSHTICAAVRECGASPVMYGIVSDDPEKTKETLEKAISQCDLVLTSGSTSAGSGDIMPHILKEHGEILAHGINIKPGKPMIIAKMEKPVIGLPGFPTSALSMFHYMVAPRIRDVLGYETVVKHRQAVLGTRVRSAGRHQLLPVALVRDCAFPVQRGSGAITTLASADGFIEIIPDIEILEAGDRVDVVLFGEESASDFVLAGTPAGIVDLLAGMMPFRVRGIHAGATASIDAVRNGTVDVACVPFHAERLSSLRRIQNLSITQVTLHDNHEYMFVVLQDRMAQEKIGALLSRCVG